MAANIGRKSKRRPLLAPYALARATTDPCDSTSPEASRVKARRADGRAAGRRAAAGRGAAGAGAGAVWRTVTGGRAGAAGRRATGARVAVGSGVVVTGRGWSLAEVAAAAHSAPSTSRPSRRAGCVRMALGGLPMSVAPAAGPGYRQYRPRTPVPGKSEQSAPVGQVVAAELAQAAVGATVELGCRQ